MKIQLEVQINGRFNIMPLFGDIVPMVGDTVFFKGCVYRIVDRIFNYDENYCTLISKNYNQ